MATPRLTAVQRAEARQAGRRMAERARSRGRRKVLSYWAEAAVEFPLLWLLRALPVDAASALGGWFGRALISRLVKGAVERTIKVAFPDFNPKQMAATIADMSENVGRVAGEIAHLGDFAGPENARLLLRGTDRLGPLAEMRRGILFVGGHFGNWELYPVALRALGLDGVSVVQHPSNPRVAAWIARERYKAGLSEQVGTGEGVYRTLNRKLKGGGVAAMLVDQRVRNGIKAPFFGVETTTSLIPARLARELDVPVVPMACRRRKGATFELEFSAPIHLRKTPDREADERAFMAQLNSFFETEIRASPGHWLWGHPRWDDALLGLEPKRIRGGLGSRNDENAANGDETGGGSA